MRDDDTQSLRKEKGEPTGEPDPRTRMRRVPVAPHSAGALGVSASPEADEAQSHPTVDPEREEASSRDES